MQQPRDKPTIGSPATSELPELLALVFARLETSPRRTQIQTALEDIRVANPGEHILLRASREDRIVAAVWGQMQPGGVASLWPPGLAPDESKATATTLIDLALTKASAAGAILVQALLETDSGVEAELLTSSGFSHATDLLYLVSQRSAFPSSPVECELMFEPLADAENAAAEKPIDAGRLQRLRDIVELTYQNTLDCPVVQGVRTVDEVLASYRGVGVFDPANWFLVQQAQTHADIGCLLLAHHPQQKNCELVYMGVAPTARGHGYGLDIVRHAQWLCGLTAAERFVLAVDAANSPAINAYAAAGFETWDRRSVFLLTDISRRFSAGS
jgi:mycothiol synthase